MPARLVACALALLLLAGCSATAEPTAIPEPEPTAEVGLPNPASVFCTEQGFTLEMRSDDSGSYGMCIFPDGSECEEWAFLRGACGPGGQPWGTTELALVLLESFPVQVRAQLSGMLPDTCARIVQVDQVYDPATLSFTLTPVVEAVAGTDCLPNPLPFTTTVDLEVIGLEAGTYTAAVGSLSETFTLSRDNRLPEEGSGPAALADADGWPMFTSPDFGFSLRFPPDWSLTETLDPAHTLAGHQIQLINPGCPDAVFTIAYKFANDDMRLVRSSMREGELVAAGTVPFLGSPVAKSVLVLGQKTLGIYYDGAGEILREPLVFTLALDYTGDSQSGSGICAGDELLADLIVVAVTLAP